MENKRLFFLFLVIVVAFTMHVRAQKAMPNTTSTDAASHPGSSEGTPIGNYNIISNLEVGWRGLGIDGSRFKYNSDLNYQPGFLVFDSSFLARARTGQRQLVDTILVTSSGFGGNPYGTLRVDAEKTGQWRLDVNYRRNSYDNIIACCNDAQARAPGPNLGVGVSQNYTTAEHDMVDADLKMFTTNRNFRPYFGFTIDRFSGPGGSSLEYAREDFAIKKNWNTKSNEVRGGVETRIQGLDVAFTQGYRWYKDDSIFSSGPNPGATLTNFATLTLLDRESPTNGHAWYSRISLHTLLAKKVDITARYIYTKSRTTFNLLDSYKGQGFLEGQNVFIDLNQVVASGTDIERPSHLLDVGVTWRVNDKLRFSDTFRYNRFRVDGGLAYSDIRFLRRQNGSLLLPSPIVLNINPYQELKVRRWNNDFEGSYDFGPRLGFFFGHRYIDRRIDLRALGKVYPLDSSTLDEFLSFSSGGEFKHNTDGFFGGFKARPFPFWNVYFDFNRGTSDNAFTRLDAYDVTSFRVRNRINLKNGLSFTASLVTRDNDNPGVADEAILGVSNFDVDIKSRIFSSTVDWAPAGGRFFVTGGYTYQHVNSDVGILFPRLNVFRPGRTQYFLRDSFFFFNTSVQLLPRISLYARYSINDDKGQNDRVSNEAAGLFIRSLPMRFQTPEARVIVRVNSYLDWTVGYQYYDYKENVTGLFPGLFVNQNYRAHLPYTSLRLYFGRNEH